MLKAVNVSPNYTRYPVMMGGGLLTKALYHRAVVHAKVTGHAQHVELAGHQPVITG